MREIKFRVWCIDRQEYEKEETYLTPDGRLFRKYVLDGKWRDDTKLHIVEFFTGLKVKGIEIYEGDRVKCCDGLNEDGSASCWEDTIESIFDIVDIGYHIVEVIGNIHDKETK